MAGEAHRHMPGQATRRIHRQPTRTANPLVREVDLHERRMHRYLLIAVLMLLPLTVLPGFAIWSSHEHRTMPTIHTVTATTNTASPSGSPFRSATGEADINKVPGHWTFRGSHREGMIPAPPGTKAHTRVLLTVDDYGQPTPPSHLRPDASVTGVAVVIVVLGVLIAIYLAARNWVTIRCDRKRMAMWDDAIQRFFN